MHDEIKQASSLRSERVGLRKWPCAAVFDPDCWHVADNISKHGASLPELFARCTRKSGLRVTQITGKKKPPKKTTGAWEKRPIYAALR